MTDQTTKLPRKKRSDAGRTFWTDRDIAALSWMAHQYAMRLDHLQVLLEHLGDRQMSLGATCSVMARWRNAGWIETRKIDASEPIWIWPTKPVLDLLNLSYWYEDISQSSVNDLKHRAAMNEIRLQECGEETMWMSERQLLLRHQQVCLPDAELHRSDGEIIAIKVQLVQLPDVALAEHLLCLLRDEQRQYCEIWYFGPASVCRQVKQVCAHLLEQESICREEAERIVVKGYPQAQENNEVLEEPVPVNVSRAEPVRRRRMRSRRLGRV